MADSSSYINIALFGLGRAGQFHINNVVTHPRTKLLYAVDIDTARVESVAKKYGCIGTTNYEEPLKDERVHAVIIATPTQTHFELLVKAIEAGKPILTEKPVSTHLRKIDQVYTSAREKNIPLLCAFNRRFDRSYKKVAESAISGDLGKIKIIKTTARDHPVPTLEYLKTSCGFIHDAGVHDIDVLCWIAQSRPIEVYAQAQTFDEEIKKLDDFDLVLMTFKFASGLMGTIDLCRQTPYGYDQRVEVFGEKGMLKVENHPDTSYTRWNADGLLNDLIQPSFPQRFREAYYLEFDHFINILDKKEEAQITQDDVRSVHIIANAAEKSARLGVPVRIQYDILDDEQE